MNHAAAIDIVRRRLAMYATDPVAYAADVLGFTVTPQQAEVARKLCEPPYRVLVPSANNVGKTFAAAWLANWFHDAFDPGAVLATSATQRQVRTQIFKEIRRLRPLGLDLKPRAAEVFHHPRHFILGFSTNKPDAFQGHHEGAMLLVMDEATGVPAEFWDRAETMFQAIAGHGWLCFYNPHDPTTPAYAAEQSGGWHVVRLAALDHPNVIAELAGKKPPVPSAIRLHRLRQRLVTECEEVGRAGRKPLSAKEIDEGIFAFDGNLYRPLRPEFEVQILGRWPTRAVDAVWSRADWRRAAVEVEPDPDWPVQIGCDVARFGSDKTAIAVRKGTALLMLESHSGWNSRQIGDRLRELCELHAPNGIPPRAIPCLIDDTGGYGAGVVDHPEGYLFLGIGASHAAREPDKYPNTRSELWWHLKNCADQKAVRLARGLDADIVTQLGRELTSARWRLDERGRRVVEGKQAIRERLRRSPDLADAVSLAWYPPR